MVLMRFGVKKRNIYEWKKQMTSYKLVDFKTLGSLIAIEEGYNAPFEIKRVYYIFDTKEEVFMLIVVKGSCTFVLDDGEKREEIKLDNKGLFMWREMKDFSSDCVLVVLASEHYDESDYIRDYKIFKKEVENNA